MGVVGVVLRAGRETRRDFQDRTEHRCLLPPDRGSHTEEGFLGPRGEEKDSVCLAKEWRVSPNSSPESLIPSFTKY